MIGSWKFAGIGWLGARLTAAADLFDPRGLVKPSTQPRGGHEPVSSHRGVQELIMARKPGPVAPMLYQLSG